MLNTTSRLGGSPFQSLDSGGAIRRSAEDLDLFADVFGLNAPGVFVRGHQINAACTVTARFDHHRMTAGPYYPLRRALVSAQKLHYYTQRERGLAVRFGGTGPVSLCGAPLKRIHPM